MKEKINFFNRKNLKYTDNKLFNAVLFNLDQKNEVEKLQHLLDSDPTISIFDTITAQLSDLIHCKNPGLKKGSPELNKAIAIFLQNHSLEKYGTWVYYPWSKKMVHILEEKDFVTVRTNRNKNKITEAEQKILSTKTIGIIGLSVGQSVALTMATERICGELRLADFDTLDLSNLNRLKASVADIGIPKTVVAARQIAEIDPYLKVTLYNEGITEENIEDFLLLGSKIDLLIEECDSFPIKVLSRLKARENLIPVVMDTSDNGLIDIERFDLEPNRKLFHGLLQTEDYKEIKYLNKDEQTQLILKTMEYHHLSDRLKESFSEIGKSLLTWPQLASSVVSGGGNVTNVSRKILLGQSTSSGRYYINTDEIH